MDKLERVKRLRVVGSSLSAQGKCRGREFDSDPRRNLNVRGVGPWWPGLLLTMTLVLRICAHLLWKSRIGIAPGIHLADCRTRRRRMDIDG